MNALEPAAGDWLGKRATMPRSSGGEALSSDGEALSSGGAVLFFW